MAGRVLPALFGPAGRNTEGIWRPQKASSSMISTRWHAAAGSRRRAHSSRCRNSAVSRPETARTAVVTRSHAHEIGFVGGIPTVRFAAERPGVRPGADIGQLAAYMMTIQPCGYRATGGAQSGLVRCFRVRLRKPGYCRARSGRGPWPDRAPMLPFSNDGRIGHNGGQVGDRAVERHDQARHGGSRAAWLGTSGRRFL